MDNHANVAQTWSTRSFYEQMAHIGAEIGRAAKWKEKGKDDYMKKALYRALELIDLTITHADRVGVYRELSRLRSICTDYFLDTNEFHTTRKSFDQYFYSFTYVARAKPTTSR